MATTVNSSNASSSVGVDFQRGDGDSSGATFTTIGEVKSVTWSGKTRDVIEVTHLGLDYREYIGGFRDAGEITLSLNFVNANYDTIMTDFNYATDWFYKLVLNDSTGTEWLFSALIRDVTPVTAPEGGDVVTLDVTLKISGQDQLLN